jgi:hypothetical protein
LTFASSALAGGVWHGKYSARITGKNHIMKKGFKTQNVNATTHLDINQNGDNITVTLGGFGGVSSATILKGKVGNGKMTANWWHSGSPHQTKVMFGHRRKDGVITGKIIYPRSAANLVPGWVNVTFTARPKHPKAHAAAAASNVHVANTVATQINPNAFVNKGIDPAAHKIKFDIIRRDNQFNGRVRITGIVKNVGTDPYIDPRGRSGGVRLFRGKPFTNEMLVKSAPLKNLQPGEKQVIVYERNWNSSSPSEGEFPPTYWLDITYDPDIMMDSCPTNDDKNYNNNRKSESGMAINTLFRNTSGTTVGNNTATMMRMKPYKVRKYPRK